MNADDGNKPKGRILKALENRGGVRIGDIRPVTARLRELLRAHRGELSPEQREMLEALDKAAPKQGGGDSPKPPDEGPGEDFQKDLKIGPSSTEVPRKKKPGEPGESLIDTRHPEPTTPERDRYLSISPPGRPDLLPDFMRDRGASEAPSDSDDWERKVVGRLLRDMWAQLPKELRDVLEADGRLDDRDREQIVTRLYLDSQGNQSMFDSSEGGLRGLAYFDAFGKAIRDAIEEYLGEKKASIMLRFFGMEASQVRRTVSADELAKRRVPGTIERVQADQDQSKRLQDALDALGKGKPSTTLNPALREALEKLTYGKSTPLGPALKKAFEKLKKQLCPSQTSPVVFDPRTGQPVLKGPSSPDTESHDTDEKKADPVRSMLDKDKRLDDSDKDAIAEAVSARGGEAGQNGKTIGDIVREEVERYLAKGNAPKTTLQIDAEAAVRILREFCSDMAVLEQQEKEGWLSPFVDEANRTEVNGWSLPTIKTVQIYWHSEAEVLESIRVIPESLLDAPIPGGMTVRELLNEVARSSSFESVKDAAMEKLQ